MSTHLPLEDSIVMEKKIFTPKGGCLMQVDASRLRQDGSSLGGNQVSSPYPKPKTQKRSRRDQTGGTHGSVHFRPEPTSSQRSSTSKGRKGKNTEELELVGDEDDRRRGSGTAEVGSVQLQGSKKQNLNHLLNFHFTPREAQHGRGGSVHHGYSNRPSIRPKQMHDSYIQANCQFIVSSDDDVEYQVDSLINWKSVEQIVIRTYGGTPACPICLCSPSAAKITKCGHIFCWSCILRYFSYGDGCRPTQPCPICFQLISAMEMKSVVANLVDEVHVGDLVKMELMCRKKNSAASNSVPITLKLNGSTESSERRFQKILRFTPEQIRSQVLEREHVELTLQRHATIESLETEFVMLAMAELESRTKVLLDKMAVQLCMSKDSGNCVKDGLKRGRESIPKVSSGSVDVAELKPSTEAAINWDEYTCFYQAGDGSNTFMSPLNVAMFWKHFGPNPAEWPQTMQLKVVEIEMLTVTAELRKRFKFLQYVPLCSSIKLLEFDLKGIVDKNVLGEFSHQLSERKRRRSERARIEKRRDRMHQEAERMASIGPEKPKIESFADFPECRSPEAAAQALEFALQASLTENERHSFSESATVVLDVQQCRPCPSLSFAQALNNPAQSKPFYTSKPANTSSNSGTSVVSDHSETQVDQNDSHVPAFRASVSDAIASAFANFALAETVAGESSSGPNKKKGRKNKGKVLFATAMGMGNN